LSHYNRYKAEGRYSYYTKQNPHWGKKTREDNERRQKNQEEWDKWSAIWLTRKQVAEELGITTAGVHYRIKKAKEAGISIEIMSLPQGNTYKELINPKDVDKLRETITPIPAEYITAEDAATILGITYNTFQAYRSRSGVKYRDMLPPDLVWKETHGNKITKNLYLREKVEIFAKNREEEREALQQKRLEEQFEREKAKKDIENKLQGLLTTAEVAHMIEKAKMTVSKYVKQGYFPVAMEHGGTKYYRKEDIEAYMVKREEEKQERKVQQLAKAADRRRKQRQNPAYRLRDTVRALVYHMIALRKGQTKGGSTFKHLPYTPADLREHLEKQFDKHMSWDNYGSYWQLDHIIPCAALQYDSLTHPNFAKCWALNNLQPLEKSKNASKGSWYEGKYHRYKKSGD
tara:strand:- start:527 stop:1732 length:1206 start_codon:yes stop_codon:yes gene_type:complete